MNYHQKYQQQHKEQFREYGRKWRVSNREKMKEISRENYRKNRMDIINANLEWQRANPEKVVVQNLVKTKIRNGQLERPMICSVCNETDRIEAHHKDYAKPLEITWLCHSCHKLVHNEALN